MNELRSGALRGGKGTGIGHERRAWSMNEDNRTPFVDFLIIPYT
jgi:hypothetical protein